MSDPSFLDTNVLLYAYDPEDSRKQDIARELLIRAPGGAGVISTQVLAEFASVLFHKKSPPSNPESIREALSDLTRIRVVAPSPRTISRAVDVKEKYGVHFYDGLIVAAAEASGCARIWSEDLAAGQDYFGVRVENPFA